MLLVGEKWQSLGFGWKTTGLLYLFLLCIHFYSFFFKELRKLSKGIFSSREQ